MTATATDSVPRVVADGASRVRPHEIMRIVRLHTVNPSIFFLVPAMILGGAWAVTMVIALILRGAGIPMEDTGFQYSWAVLSPQWYLIVVGVQAVSYTFPFALGFGATRRDYWIGTSIMFVLASVLFALAKALGEAWPGDVSRRTLIARAFRGKDADDSHRARLRVEIGRLRAALRPLADIGATPDGFALTPHHNRKVAVLTPPVDDPDADVMALLADGEAWSSSALAIALDTSQRTVQRALDTLAESGTVQSHGRGRARRWSMPPIAGFTTTLLLPAPLPDG